MLADALQTTLEEAVPLPEVEFVVVDLETTGGSPADSRITEIGAVKVRGGERIGMFQTLVNPGVPIPRSISHLTGIDDLLVARRAADRGGAAGVPGVRARLRLRGAQRAVRLLVPERDLERLDYDPLPPPPVCTAKLARRVVWPDVPNVRLQTLAQYFRTAREADPSGARPTPRRARRSSTGCSTSAGGSASSRSATCAKPSAPEGGRTSGRSGSPTTCRTRRASTCSGVGTAACSTSASRDDLRDAREVLLLRRRAQEDREPARRDLGGRGRRVPGGELEALVLEARLIRQHEPKYNRRGKTWRRFAYLKLDPARGVPADEGRARPQAATAASTSGRSRRRSRARLAKEALEDVVPAPPLHHGDARVGTRFAPCALADIGRCPAPCDGRDRPRALRRARPAPSSPPSSPPGRAPRSARGADARPRRAGAVRGGRARTRSPPRARRGAGTERGATPGSSARPASSWSPWTIAGSPSTEGRCARGDRGRDEPLGNPCPRERADELSAVRSWILRNEVRIESHATFRSREPVDGGAALSRILGGQCAERLDPRATWRRLASSERRGRPPRAADVGDLRRLRSRLDGPHRGRVLLGARARKLDRLPGRGRGAGPPLRGARPRARRRSRRSAGA